MDTIFISDFGVAIFVYRISIEEQIFWEQNICGYFFVRWNILSG